MKQKSMFASVTLYVNLISFILLWITSQTFAQTFWGGFSIYALNIILNALRNNTPIKTLIELPISMTAMKVVIYAINVAGIVVQLCAYLTDHGVLNPAVWLTMLISLLTFAMRALTTPPTT